MVTRITVNKSPSTAGSNQSLYGSEVNKAFPQFDSRPVPEPQRAYNFLVVMPDVGSAKPIVEAVEAPAFVTFEIQPEPIGGRHRFVVVSGNASPLNMVLYHDTKSKKSDSDISGGQTAMNYIRKWQNLVQNDDGTLNYPEDSTRGTGYKKDIFVTYLNVDLSESYHLKYKGCFPVQVAPLRFAYKDSVRTMLQVSFSVDRIIDITGKPPGESPPPTRRNETPVDTTSPGGRTQVRALRF
jgi:hypothetical protein